MKQIPNSLETEKQILHTFINNPALLIDSVDLLKVSDFYNDKSQKIFKTLLFLHSHDRAINELSVYEEILKDDKAFDPSWVVDIYSGDPVSLNQHVHYLKQLAKRRELIDKTTKLLQLLYEEKNHEDLLEDVDRTLFDMSLDTTPRKHISGQIFDAMASLEDRISGHGVTKTGYEELDRMISGGFFAGQLIILGARTSIGKSSFAVSLAHNIMAYGKKLLFISLEMPANDIVYKSLSIESGVDFGEIMRGAHRTTLHNDALSEAQGRIAQWPYLIEDAKYSLADIKIECRKAKKEENIQFIIIDYLGLIHAERYKENKVLEIAYITRSLKLLAKELDIPILVLCQINREAEHGDKIPQLVNLRDSGAIEQDADIVLLLYREYYYNNAADPHEAMLIIAKQRLGPTCRLTLYYEPSTMHFRDSR